MKGRKNRKKNQQENARRRDRKVQQYIVVNKESQVEKAGRIGNKISHKKNTESQGNNQA